MRRLLIFLLLAPCLGFTADQDFSGKWNIKVFGEPRSRVWWLEVTGAGTADLKARFVGAPGGGLDEISDITIRNGELIFSLERRVRTARDQEGELKKLTWRARLVNGKLQGTYELEDKSSPTLKWSGERAPVIDDRDDGTWREGTPVSLFNGKDLSNWRPMIPRRPLGWTVKDGVMTNVAGANNLYSKEKFWNFKLHAEYRVGKGSNSGIGLRGRYEVQILEDFGRPHSKHTNGALYSRIAPALNASKPPDEWQTFDITLIGRQVTVVLNGEKIIDKQEIEGFTAMAHDVNEAEPGPISLQGDHGPVEFRKLVVTPLVK